MNGQSSLTMRVSGTLATTDVTNSNPPTGGVIMPIVKFTITMIANCRSLIPSACAIGARIGTSTTMPGSGSIKMPNASNNTLTASRNATGLKFRPTMYALNSCGTRETVRTHAKAADIATMINTADVIMAERARIDGSIAQFSVR